MNAKPFLDTNVVLYGFRQGDSRSQKAEALLAEGGAIAGQVLHEFVAVARRKLNKSWEEVRHAVGILRVFFSEPVTVTVKTHHTAISIAERYKYSIYNGLILAQLRNGLQSRLLRRSAGRPGDREKFDNPKSLS